MRSLREMERPVCCNNAWGKLLVEGIEDAIVGGMGDRLLMRLPTFRYVA